MSVRRVRLLLLRVSHSLAPRGKVHRARKGSLVRVKRARRVKRRDKARHARRGRGKASRGPPMRRAARVTSDLTACLARAARSPARKAAAHARRDQARAHKDRARDSHDHKVRVKHKARARRVRINNDLKDRDNRARKVKHKARVRRVRGNNDLRGRVRKVKASARRDRAIARRDRATVRSNSAVPMAFPPARRLPRCRLLLSRSSCPIPLQCAIWPT